MSWRAALACCALLACSPAKRNTCPLDERVVAQWMTSKRLGLLAPNDPPAVRLYWQEHYSGILFALQSAPIDNWCAERREFADTSCWATEEDDRPQCVAGRSQVLDINVGGGLCARLVRWFGADALALAHGAKLDMRNTEMMQRYSFYSRRYDTALEQLKPSMSQICAYVGGMPLRCYLDPEHPTCRLAMNTIERYVRDVLTE